MQSLTINLLNNVLLMAADLNDPNALLTLFLNDLKDPDK